MTLACILCGEKKVAEQLNFGSQPVCNDFQTHSENQARHYLLALGQCKNCSLIQLTNGPSPEQIRPKLNWLQYNEPEGHLDHVVADTLKLLNIQEDWTITGATYKDSSTLARFQDKTDCQTNVLEPNELTQPYGLETIQQQICLSKVTGEAAELVVARHIVEHSERPLKLISQLASFLKPNGHLLIELPASEAIFKHLNHPFIWEEHFSYFTDNSIKQLVALSPFQLVKSWRFNYTYEDSLVLLLAKTNDCQLVEQQQAEAIDNFCHSFNAQKTFWQNKLTEYKQNQQKVAIFGAGHMCIRFINFYQLAPFIDYVVDDNPKKLGLYLPGCNLKIISSDDISDSLAPICISTLSPESEINARKKNKYLGSNITLLRAFNSDE